MPAIFNIGRITLLYIRTYLLFWLQISSAKDMHVKMDRTIPYPGIYEYEMILVYKTSILMFLLNEHKADTILLTYDLVSFHC